MGRDAVVCFLRHGTELLLCRREDGRWDGVSAAIDEGDDPETTAEGALEEVVADPSAWSLPKGGEPTAPDARAGRVYPFCFEGDDRELAWGAGVEHEWRQPPAMLDRATVPGLWAAYREVGPSVASVRGDDDHGAAYVSLRALEALRDRAAELAAADPDQDRAAVEPIARELLAARASMAVVRNRLNRVLATGDETVAAIRDRAMTACEAALDADEAAAERAAEAIGARVFTLSRSGTVLRALRASEPEAVFVAESRPGREGIGVAERLAANGVAVTVLADAAVGGLIADGAIDTVLVGADSVLADGDVVNKVGTRHAARAADDAGVACLAVCSRDKIAPGTDVDVETGASEAVYAGEADLSVHNPTFERVPASLFSGVVTESGVCSPEGVRVIAEEHAELAEWDE